MIDKRNDQKLLGEVVSVVTAAVDAICSRFSIDNRPSGMENIMETIRVNDTISMGILRAGLYKIGPEAIILEDELGTVFCLKANGGLLIQWKVPSARFMAHRNGV